VCANILHSLVEFFYFAEGFHFREQNRIVGSISFSSFVLHVFFLPSFLPSFLRFPPRSSLPRSRPLFHPSVHQKMMKAWDRGIHPFFYSFLFCSSSVTLMRSAYRHAGRQIVKKKENNFFFLSFFSADRLLIKSHGGTLRYFVLSVTHSLRPDLKSARGHGLVH